MIINQQFFTDAFIFLLSGSAKMKNEKEIHWENEYGVPITIEFPTQSPTYAIVRCANGNKRWYLNGKYHREDGPAIECADGDKFWCLNGKWHREDGPAIECANGDKYWYLNDEQLSEKEWKQTK